jgi:hypothetical protein
VYENTFFASPPFWMLVVTGIVPLVAWSGVRTLQPTPLGLARAVVAISVLVPATLLVLDRQAYERVLYENGPVELWTACLLLGGGVAAFARAREQRDRTIRLALVLLGVVLLIAGGEELSWGQNIFQWQSPEFFQRWNRQEETNLHNITQRIFHTKGLTIVVLLVVGVAGPRLARRWATGTVRRVALALLPPAAAAPLFLVASVLCLDAPTGLEAELGELVGAELLLLTMPLLRRAAAERAMLLRAPAAVGAPAAGTVPVVGAAARRRLR